VLGKLYHTAAVVSIAIVLAAGAVSGLMYGSGKLTAERVDQIAAILRGEPTDDETVAADSTDSEFSDDDGGGAASADEIRQQRREMQLRRALSERARRDLISQRELLDQALQHLITAEEQFASEQARANAELKRRRGQVRDAGFDKELKLVSKLPARQAKAHVMQKFAESPADAVRLLNTLPESSVKRILGQMKTPEELQIMHELLERLTKNEVDRLEPRSGTTAGN
jgi:flagellar motility protein MotE (MotC chaperone)